MSDKDIAILGAGMHPWGKWGRNFVEYGVIAAHAAGIRCIGLAHSRTQENLLHADWAFSGFEELDLEVTAKEFE